MKVASDELIGLFETVYFPKKLALKSDGTAGQYRQCFRRMEQFLGRPAVLADLTDETILACSAWLLKSVGQERATVAKFQRQMASFWGLMARKRLVEFFPEFDKMQEPGRIPIAWTREELKILWDRLTRMGGTVAGIPRSVYFCSLACVCWDTLERISPLMNAKRAWFDLPRGFVHIPAEFTKTKERDGMHELHPLTVEWLRKALALSPINGRVWPWPYHPSYLQTYYGREVLEPAGLPNDRWHKFHCFRRSGATHIAAMGGDASKSLGHKSPELADQHYVDPRQLNRPTPAKMLFRMGD